MTDQELLTYAAKAAGHDLKFSQEWHDKDDPQIKVTRGKWVGRVSWNPLENDADAFQLMVKLNIQPIFSLNEWGDFVNTSILESEYDGEKFQALEEKSPATRRAIVRAAAEIGKGM